MDEMRQRFVLLTPGTADTDYHQSPQAARTQFKAHRIRDPRRSSANGARTDMVNYNLDGGSNEDPYTNVNNPFPES